MSILQLHIVQILSAAQSGGEGISAKGVPDCSAVELQLRRGTMSPSMKCSTIGMFCIICSALVGCKSTPHSQPATRAAQAEPHWSYGGKTGPEYWGSLSPDYALCATGKLQSPIDIVDTTAKDLPNISFQYQAVPLEILNNGHCIQVNYAPGSYIELDGERFDLIQFHFHTPSEHRVRARAAAAEMHFVHKSASGGLAVVGVFIDVGPHNARFDPIWNNLPASPAPARRLAASIHARDLLPPDLRTFRYEGSLTTPPGTEGVKWCLLIQPIHMSSEQLAALRRIVNGNNRPTQPLNGRMVIEDSSR